MKLLTALCLFLLLTGCVGNVAVKEFGAHETKLLPAGKKLVNVTWKDADLWILLRDKHPGERPETYEFVEQSTYGVFQGAMTLKESE